MKIINVIVISIFFFNVSYSQKTETGNWFIYFGNQKINKNINWHNEIQHRNYNFIGDFNQLILRTGIGFNLTEDNNNLLLGYGYINTEKYLSNSDQKVNVNEHRIFQQFISKQNFGRFFVQHRYRVEERFLKNDFQLRLRYFLGINIPLNKKTLEKNTIYLSSYNEIFINSEKPLFDRNRLYGALGYFIHKNLKMEVGFMSQSLEDSNRNQFQIAIFNNFSI
jgi:intein/homing endonuclease